MSVSTKRNKGWLLNTISRNKLPGLPWLTLGFPCPASLICWPALIPFGILILRLRCLTWSCPCGFNSGALREMLRVKPWKLSSKSMWILAWLSLPEALTVWWALLWFWWPDWLNKCSKKSLNEVALSSLKPPPLNSKPSSQFGGGLKSCPPCQFAPNWL